MKKLHFIILLLCVIAGEWLFHDFFAHSRTLWTGLVHDRNGHYGYGLDMALALEHGNVGQFFAQLEKGKVWPPLHGLLVTFTQLLTGNDWRFAVLPSLIGWMLTLYFVYFTAQKIAPSSVAWAAGVTGFVFAVLSPGGRAYGTDIMLESLGAGLTMLVLASYASAVEERDSQARWRAVAIALTVMFFEKYNYWMIVAVSLAAAEFNVLLSKAKEWLQKTDVKKLCIAQLREPLNWLLLILTGTVLWIFAHGPTVIVLFGKRVSLYPPHNLVTVTYAVFFIRMALAIRRTGWKPADAQERMLWRWHILPLAISFLLPQRLSVFVGFLSPANHDVAPRNFTGAITYYSSAFATDYNISVAFAILAVLLACAAVLHFRSLGPGARAVLVCMLLGAALNILHPNQKSRYMHSWIPAVWTSAGLGAALLLSRVPRRSIVAGVGVTALAAAGGWAWHIKAASEPQPSYSLLKLSDAWLADVGAAPKVAFFSTQTCRSFMEWTFLAQGHSRDQFEWPAWQDAKTDDEIRAGFEQWIAQTKADAVVFLNVPEDSPEYVYFCDQTALRKNLGGLLGSQTRFVESKQFNFLQEGCTVTTWVKH